MLLRDFNSKAFHLARTVEPQLLLEAARLHDFAVNKLFCSVVHGLQPARTLQPLHHLSTPLRRARLPMAYGGSGITSLEALRHPGILASIAQSWTSLNPATRWKHFKPVIQAAFSSLAQKLQLVSVTHPDYPLDLATSHLANRVHSYCSAFDKDSLLRADGVSVTQHVHTHLKEHFLALVQNSTGGGHGRSCQGHLTSIGHSYQVDLITRDIFTSHESRVAAGSTSSKSVKLAAFLSSMCPQAVQWHHCSPLALVPANHIPPAEYNVLLAYHFGLPMPGRTLMSDQCCGDRRHKLDRLGHHVINCPTQRTMPHNRVRDILHSFCRSVHIPAVTEPTGVLRQINTTSLRRPDLLARGLGSNAKDLICDVVTCDASAPSVMRTTKSYKVVGAACTKAVADKRRKYSGQFNSNTIEFKPVAIELSGRWSPELLNLINKIKRRGCATTLLDSGTEQLHFKWWNTALAVGFMRAVAQAGLNMQDQLMDVSGDSDMMGPYELAHR